MCNNKMQYDDGWSIYFNIALAPTARTEQYVVATCMAIKLMAVGSAVVSDNDATSLHLRTIRL